jgi:hypothetical protein
MRRWLLPLCALLLPATPARAADSLGVFGGWGAFRDRGGDKGEGRCYAIAEPDRSSAGGSERAFAAVGSWSKNGVRGQLYLRLSRPPADGGRVYLSIGERRFALVSGAGQAWAQDARMDGAIIAAMRAATTMSVEGKARNGRGFYDLYVLKGAATAMDAAALACFPQ